MATNVEIDYNRVDKGTLSNYQDVTLKHMHFDWTVDFDGKKLEGSVTLQMAMATKGVEWIHLDSSKLKVISAFVNDVESTVKIDDPYKALGNKLSISVPEKFQKLNQELKVVINYIATSDSNAMQWLDPSLTKGGKHPYLFTQCQAIHARSMFPCQDTPGVKCPYSAVVNAPEWCTVLMSALADDSVVPSNRRGQKGVFGWKQPMRTCAYLVALAAGDLASREISPRVKVWSEPSMVDDAAFEFSETETFLQAAESLTCPYQWGRYDVLCLPPSFPYGGMENPCLTFATPTLLAGDKSLADVIAHEIAHSWTGNLVTNATWEHFWLNEGWTVWLERKIAAKVKGSDEFRKLSATSGWKTLIDSVNAFGETHEYTKLSRMATDDDPDDAFSSVPYEKGFNLLYYLENLVGGDLFESFVKSYIDKFKNSTATSGEFRDFFVEYMGKNGSNEVISAVGGLNWDMLYHSPGMPLHPHPDFSTDLAKKSKVLASKWIDIEDSKVADSSFDKTEIQGWSTGQMNVFLDTLLLHGTDVRPLSAEKLEHMDKVYGFSQVKNNEIKFRWQCLCLKTGVAWIVPQVLEFVKSQGRMKYVRPLYRHLNNCSAVNGTRVAKTTFIECHHTYHPIARKMLQSDLAVTNEELKLVTQSTSSGSASTDKPDVSSGSFLSSWAGVATISSVVLGAVGLYLYVQRRNAKK